VLPAESRPPGESSETASLRTARPERQGYLLVVHNTSSTMLPLPEQGELIIGRGADAGVRVDNAEASRRHASLVVSPVGARLTDLGSRNGTSLNGLRLTAPRDLGSGDVISVGDTMIIVHLASAAPGRARALDDIEALRRRIEQEIDRARAYDLSFALMAVGPFATEAQRQAAVHRLVGELPVRNTLAADADGFLWGLLPELRADEARSSGSLLLRAPALAGVSVGVAAYPQDACDADALIRLARLSASGQAMTHKVGDGELVVASPAMVRLYSLIRRLARSDLPVLVRGETGVGKEHAAQAVHAWSPREKRPFHAINCAALPETLAESALFGHERGAFTGATERRAGVFESAEGGTLFLDEVGEMPLSLQAKLLRALESRRITRLGSTRETAVDVRLVAATNRDLEAEVKAGRFRQDLLFRLGASVVEIPPLRDRPEEILLLAHRFLAEACDKLKRPHLSLAAEAAHRLMEHPWPGNVRELRHAISHAVVVAEGDSLLPWDLPGSLGAPPNPALGPSVDDEALREPAPSLPGDPASGPDPDPPRPTSFLPLAEEIKALERQRIQEALVAADGVQRHAAALLHMPLRTFCVKLRQYGLTWPERWRRREQE